MDKLVSVQKTVDHSSTIISDILSRILNETVMKEERLCRICFNLLNDIDYHLKEAQEKTDEVTAKFLDKEKNPLKYNPVNPQQMVDPRKGQVQPHSPSKKHKSKVIITSGGRPPNVVSRTIQTEFKTEESDDSYRPRSPSHIPVKGGGKGHSFLKSPENRHSMHTDNMKVISVHPHSRDKEAKFKSPKKHQPQVQEDQVESADEMTKNKRRLLSRVLAPSKKIRHSNQEYLHEIDSEDESKLTIDMEEKILREKRKKEKKQRRREKKQRLLEQMSREKQSSKHQEVLVIDPPSDDHEHDHHVADHEQDHHEADLSPVQYHRATVQQPVTPSSSPQKSKDIHTVDLSQLGDLFSVPVTTAGQTIITMQPQPQLYHQQEDVKVFAKKSVPVKQNIVKTSLEEQVEAAPIFILPDQVQGMTAVTSIASMTINPGQEIPIIDCRPMLSNQHRQAEINNVNMTELRDGDDSDNDPTYEPLPDKITLTVDKKENLHIMGQINPSPPKANINQATKVEVLSPNKISDSLLKRHSGVPSVPCPHCPKLFMRGYNMRVHIDRVHNKSKPWQCQYCTKTFATTSDLKQHLSSHGMGKIHKCEDCGREFTNRDSAILHRKQHNNERTHFCPECSKGFFKASCLQRHMRSHTGEKPYACEFCKRGFSQVTTLKNHKKACKFAGKEVEMNVENLEQIS